MTDKQIIIDGVDIAGCEFAVKPINDNRIKCHCAKGLLQIVKMQEQPESIKSGLCENNPNCYYKQLKRKEQENNSLQAQVNNITVQSNNAITVLEQENEELKQTLAEIKGIAKSFCNVCKEFEPEKCKSNNYMYCNYNKILAIINETLKDE